jgi:hypothetical protein
MGNVIPFYPQAADATKEVSAGHVVNRLMNAQKQIKDLNTGAIAQ